MRAPLAGAALATLIALVAGAWAAPAFAALPNQAGASADCVPVEHTKRVTKRVKMRRNGRVVKAKRKKTIRWTTCEQRPSAPSPASPASLAPCPEPASQLGVVSRDNAPGPRYTLSRACVTAGSVEVQLDNQGQDPHNILLRPAGTPSTTPATYTLPGTPPFEVGPLAQAEDTFVLTVGDWYMWCDLQGGLHELEGMYATLPVR